MRYDVHVKTYMKTKDAIKVGREVFSAEPSISRVNARLLSIRDETNYIDLTIFVDGDHNEGMTRVIPLVFKFMDRVAEVPVEYMILPTSSAHDHQHQHDTLVYSRD